MRLNPYIKPRFNNTQMVMLDVIIALLPILLVGFVAYGTVILQQVGIALATALVTEFIFSAILLKKYNTMLDGSAAVTALLLVFIVSPITPWYILAFGVFSAILFGKIVWGGLGKNRFNPALIGREFMTVFFATVMTSPNIWKTQDLILTTAGNLFAGVDLPFLSNHLNALVFKTTGALGEYSIVAIALGGFYLLIRNRISWHIPFSLIISFTFLTWMLGGEGFSFSMSGLLLGTIFMATDMPSSPTNANGKLYYGMMIGVAVFILIKGGVRFEYMSYSILLLNAFSEEVSRVFKPTPWGVERDWKNNVEEVFMISLKILSVVLAVITLHYYNLINYILYIYILYCIIKFNYSFNHKVNNAI